MKQAAMGAGLAVLLVVVTFGPSTAQTLAFEIADIHTSTPVSNPSMRGPYLSNGRYQIQSANMVDLVRIAYRVDADRIVGGPNWLEMDRYDIIAKIPAGAKPDTMRLMLQALLADRFKLVVHDDVRPAPAYVLTATKPSLKSADGAGEVGCKILPHSDPTVPMTIQCRNMTMAAFAEAISQFPQGIASRYKAVDQTALKGAWNFDFKYNLGGPGTQGVVDKITFFDAIQKQLGLDLTLSKAPLPVIVVDSANEKPSANAANIAERIPPITSEFEVADIKPTAPGGPATAFQISPGQVTVRGWTLRRLIIRAWSIYPNRPEELVAGPAFLDTEKFDIVAKAPAALPVLDATSGATGSTAAAALDNETVNAMLKALLIDRFKIVSHFEDRPLGAFTLTATKPKLQKADPSNRTNFRLMPGNARQWMCQNLTMAQFAAHLQEMAGGYIQNRNVLDATGLDGAFDFTFSFTTAVVDGPPRGGAGAGTGEALMPDSSVTLSEALEKQLGLKLETTKRPSPVLVIDRIEPKPTAN